MLKKLIGIFIVFSPFTSYFAISSWLRFPVILLLLLTLIFITNIILQKKISVNALRIDSEDLLLVAFLTTVSLSWLMGFQEGRSFNHSLAYIFAIGLYYFIFKIIVNNNDIGSFFILRHLAISSIICCVIIIIDWIFINFIDFGIRDYFVDVENKSANMLYFQRAYFYSVGGVAEEPGSMALLLNIIAPLGLLYFELKQNIQARTFLLVIYAISLFCLFSTAGFVNVIIAGSIMVGYNLITVHKISITYHKLSILLTGILVVGITAITNQKLIANIINEVSQKLLLNSKDASANIRTETWYNAFNDWLLNPSFGNGPGYGVHVYGSGYHSVYLTILADIGILGIIIFMVFLILKLLKLIQLPRATRFHIGTAFIATVLHFAIVGDFYHAPFWILLILIGKLNLENKTLKPSNENFYYHPNL